MTQIISDKKLAFLSAGLTLFFFSFFIGAWFGGDDFVHIHNLDFNNGNPLLKAVTGHVFENQHGDNHYRPLTNIILAILLIGKTTYFPRIVIFLLHISNGFLVCLILRQLKINEWLTVMSGLFFIFNPAVNSTIFWISAIGDILATNFGLVCLYLFLDTRWEKHQNWMILFFILGLFCKEMVITLPAVCLFLAIITEELDAKIKIVLKLFGIAVTYFILRGLIIGSFIAGGATDMYFPFDKTVLISFIKYVYTLIIPFPIHLIYENPLLIIFPIAIYAVILGHFLTSKPSKAVLKKCSIALSIVLIVMLPVIFKYAPWYLYFISVFWIIFLCYLVNHLINLKMIKFTFLLMIATSIVTMGFWGFWHIRAGNMSKDMLNKIHALDEKKIVIIGLVRGSYTSIPMLSFKGHLEKALNVFLRDKKSIDLLCLAQYKTVETQPAVTWEGEGGLMLDLSQEGYAYFYPDTLSTEHHKDGVKFQILEKNWLGKIVKIKLEVDTVSPTYLYIGNRFIPVE